MLEVLRELQSTLPGMKYSLGNGYEMVADIIKNPGPFKMKEVKEACCGLGKYNGKTFCIGPSAKLCPKRDEYLFWDWYHPTQKASRIAAATLYEGLTKYVTPINFKQLAED
ncbi:GDSL esterase/lipase [Acorus calamus]|uniref:GDSL esterase/lipase n=1 Tax=Acorus calamus TaxID=4465 RepID=A0AAV9D5Y4_ACOCL|nr:GDSL esterase/lipase [Acorus calamus]